MASFSLVHGAWHGGWAWDEVRAELEARGHDVATPDLPCDDPAATIEDYALAVPPADVVVGHSLAGHTIARVQAKVHVYLCALVPGVDTDGAFLPEFDEALVFDDQGRHTLRDAARFLQYPPEAASLATKLRPQFPIARPAVTLSQPSVYIVCTRDGVVQPDWQRRAAREGLATELIELEAGHSSMLTHARELADLFEQISRSRHAQRVEDDQSS
jgi:hypothetical protein